MLQKIPRRLWVIAAICIAIYTLWSIAYPSGSWRYKLTVEVETPEGIKTGSAVREVRVKTGPSIFPDANSVSHQVTGEAVVVDLGERGYLFALLRTNESGIDGAYHIVGSAYGSGYYDGASYVRSYNRRVAPPVTLTKLKQYPVLVRFRDLNDPKTVELVDPEDLAASFGEGVALESISVKLTREPVTVGVVGKYMPSYEPIDDFMKWLRAMPYDHPLQFGPDAFKKGF